MALAAVSLDDKYAVESGRVFLTGMQALVRLPLMQQLRDRAPGSTRPASSRAIAARRSAASIWSCGRRRST